jgi:hypothetical protein
VCTAAAAAVNVKSVQQLGGWKLYRAAKAMAVLAATEVGQHHICCNNIEMTCCAWVAVSPHHMNFLRRLQCSIGMPCVNKRQLLARWLVRADACKAEQCDVSLPHSPTHAQALHVICLLWRTVTAACY